MQINDLLNGTVLEINLNDNYLIPKNLYKNTDIIDLDPVNVNGTLTYPTSNDLNLDITVSGKMLLSDSVDLKPVKYPYSFKISENVYEKLEKDQITLDIISILWENIVLEIPLRYSEVTDYKGLSGDGWRVISEDELQTNTNNPFKELLNLNEKE